MGPSGDSVVVIGCTLRIGHAFFPVYRVDGFNRMDGFNMMDGFNRMDSFNMMDGFNRMDSFRTLHQFSSQHLLLEKNSEMAYHSCLYVSSGPYVE